MSKFRSLRALGLTLLMSCSGASDPEPDPFTIGPAGGSVSLANGSVTITIPAGALSALTTFAAASATGPSSSTVVPGTVFAITPSTTFSVPVTLTISYVGATLPTGVQESSLGIYKVVDGSWVSIPGSSVNTAAKMVTASVTSFSTYGIAGTPPSAEAEPSGMTVIGERPWNALGVCQNSATREAGWDDIEGCAQINKGNLTIISDAAAPFTAPNVAQMQYPQGFAGGVAPAVAQRSFSLSLGYKTLFIRYYLKVSSNFEGHPSSTNKIFHYWVGNPAANKVFDRLVGVAQGPLEFQVALQGVLDTRTRLTVNQPGLSGAFERNRWYKIELLFIANTPGQPNGTVRGWINGQKAIEYTDVAILDTGESPIWSQVQWSPTWGGGGGITTTTFFMWLDHTYLSAKQ